MKIRLQRALVGGVAGIAALGILSGVQPAAQAQDWRVCRQIDNRLNEVYYFATPNYYINICEGSNGEYFYAGQSRWDETKFLSLPAQSVGTGAFYAQNGDFNYSTSDLRGVMGAPGPFQVTVTRRYPNGHVEIILQEYAIFHGGGEDPSTMCNPLIEPC